jgi:uncharacterized membrane protein
MPARETIRSPIEWTGSQIVHLVQAVAWVGRALGHAGDTLGSPAPALRRITLDDVFWSLRQGYGDVAAYRSDVFFLIFFYPLAILIIARIAFGMNILPLLFPLASGSAILGPIAAVGLYEMSRQRAQGGGTSWLNGPDVLQRPAIGSIGLVGLLLGAIFIAWLAAAWVIYRDTLGPALPTSAAAFVADVFTTAAGHWMIVIGVAVGFVFAALAMSISIVSLPLLVDRDAGLDTAIKISLRAVLDNPLPIAVWGLIVAAGLIIGALPLFVGLIVVMPLLGHATWHLYTRLVVPAGAAP